MFFQETGRRAVGTHHNLAATDILVFLEHRAVGLHDAGFNQTNGVRNALVALIVGKVDRNIAADSIQLLASRNMVSEGVVIPTETEDDRRLGFTSLLDGGGKYLVQERVGRSPEDHRTDDRQGNTSRIMRVTVATARHHQALASIVHYLGLAGFNESLGSCLVAYIDVLAVLHGKGFDNLIVLGSENLAIDHEVCTGLDGILSHVLLGVICHSSHF